MRILVANVGSTSFKYKLLDMQDERPIAWGKVERIGSLRSPMNYHASEHTDLHQEIVAPDQAAAIRRMLDLLVDPDQGCLRALDEVDAVGFKAVHAGAITGALPVTEELIAAMVAYSDAAPAHNPAYIRAMRIFQEFMPETPQVALLETAFHTTIPDHAFIYSVPYEWYERHGVRRYGFHGASLRYIAERVPALLGRSSEGLRLVACHLGGSSSVCAIRDGRSVDTSMGFTPQAGVPMGTRCGDIDPFIIPFIMEREGLTPAEVRSALTQQGGLLGISGLSADVRDLEEAAAKGHARASLALASFAYEVKKFIGAYAAAMGGLDVLVFSGGIGENAPMMRARICEGLGFLGVELDPERNAACEDKEGEISKQGARVPVLVVLTDEELIVARATARVISSGQHDLLRGKE